MWLLPLLVLATAASVHPLDTTQCTAPLGMESGVIPDTDITASSSFESGNVGPHYGRVRTESHGGAWCPKYQITTEPKEWLEVDLHRVHVITAVETQGRFGNGQGQEYTEAYLLEYWRPRLGKWVRFRNFKGEEVLEGNTNTYLEAKRELDPPIWASRIRFVPYSYHRRTVCMRVELYGCYWKEGVVSYSMPQGDKRGAGWEFYDVTYDGHWDGQLQRGLGQLTDGKVGPENFKMAYYEYERAGQGWVGWRNDSRGGQPLEIKFEFDQVREFTSLHIFCNNQFTKEVQVFSEAALMFSVGGHYFHGNPITYTYMEDRIFEHSRNITVKLHHRIGRFVKLRLHFAARWIMISEITFESDIAQGNFTPEEPYADERPAQSDVFVDKTMRPPPEVPVSTAKEEDETYMAVVVGALMAVIILLAVAIFLIVSRHQKSKQFASPLAAKAALPGSTGTHQHLSSDSSSGTGTAEKTYSGHIGIDTVLLMDTKLEDYQEPYQALKYAPYYSYSHVMVDSSPPNIITHPDTGHEYAVPELGTTPLLTASPHKPEVVITRGTGKLTQDDTKGSKSPSQQEVLSVLKRRLENTSVSEIPRQRLRMLTKLGEGAFGTVFVAEADGIMEYGTTAVLLTRLVAVKFLLHDASEKEKMDFQRDVRILAALEDHNLARVLGMCSHEEPLCVVMEYLEHGDLCQFLKSHGPSDPATLPVGVKTLSYNCLLYMAVQIASGMRYLESLNFVHRDLSTRNCLVGKAYHIKISDFGTDNALYAEDYYKVEGGMALPVRWMAWESIYLGKYTTKSDVWSFGVTLWEILHLARRRPYDSLTDAEVVDNLGQLYRDEDDFLYLPKPAIPPATKDIVDLMAECWRRQETERPSFREIHLFLQRKTLGYAPTT